MAVCARPIQRGGIMAWITQAFEHIPEAAGSPLALVAYLIAVISATILSIQGQRNRTHLRLIRDLPKDKREGGVSKIIGRPLPGKFTGEEWIRHRRNVLLLTSLGVLCVTGIIVFAIAAVTAPNAAPKMPTPVEADAALLGRFDLKLDKDYVHQLLGSPQFREDAQANGGVHAEVYSKNGYTLTVGYDRSNKVSIYSIVVNDAAFLKTEIAGELSFTKTYQELKADAFIAKDMSSKFYYYAEGHVGSTTADGFVTLAYFYTDTGLEPGTELLPPSVESDGLVFGDPPIQNADANAWRAAARPNGYLRASDGTEVSGFYFHDMDWKDITQS